MSASASRLMRNCTKWSRTLFTLATGISVTDTQTGLRAIPASFMRELLDCPGERFEFETHMLLRLRGRPVVQIPIQTLYIDGNRETHFSPWRDSPRIMSIIVGALLARMARFCMTSLLSFALDIALFSFLFHCVFRSGGHIAVMASVVLARAVSLVFNYWANRIFVFGHETAGRTRHAPGSFARYLGLAAAVMIASYALTNVARQILQGVRIEYLKAAIDLCLWLVSYGVQRTMVFRGVDARRGGEA